MGGIYKSWVYYNGKMNDEHIICAINWDYFMKKDIYIFGYH